MFETILGRISSKHRRTRRNRNLKEGFWKSDESARVYAINVSATSVGMQTELDIARQIAKGHVLDLGAGTGRFSRPLAESGLQVTAADISNAMLQTGLQSSLVPYECVVTSALDPDLPKSNYDTVVSFWLMLHFAEWKAILGQIVELAKPGALIAFEFPNRSQYDEVARRDPERVRTLTKQIGYETWLSEHDVQAALTQLGCSLLWTRPYDIFNDNWLVRLKMGDGYEAWKTQVATDIYADETCRKHWQHFEATQLPTMHPALGRKRLFVAQKSSQPTISFNEAIQAPAESSPAFEHSRAVFDAAFSDYL